jgi:branched-chain amino acid transport system substrate-binding protein
MTPANDERLFKRRLGRRQLLRGAALGATGLAVAGIVGCADDDEEAPGVTPGPDETPTGPDLDQVLIGAIWPLTGALSFEGTQARNAMDLFIDQYNEAGGVASLGGAQLVARTRDTESSPDVGISAVDRLVQSDGVAIIHGAYQSGTVIPTTERAERFGVPYMVTGGLAEEIMTRGLRYVFRHQAGARVMCRDTFSYLREIVDAQGADVTTMVHLHEDSPYGSSVADFSPQAAADNGFELERVSYSFAASDLTPELLRVQSINPDMMICTGYLPDGILITRTLGTMGYMPPFGACFLGAGSVGDPRFVDEVGREGENFANLNSGRNAASDLTVEFQEAYQARFGDFPGIPAVISHIGMAVIADAIERAASDDPEAIAEAMRATSLDPATTIAAQAEPIEFDEAGENRNATMVMYQSRADEGPGTVWIWPREFSNAELAFPFRPA